MGTTRGTFIVCEGPDGAGKSFLSEIISKNKNFVLVKSPSGILRDFISESYGKVSARSWNFLWLAEMIDLWDRQISPALKSGKNVIADRWTWISRPIYARFLLDVPFASTVPLIEHVMSFYEIKKPDCVLLLDAPVNILMERISARNMDYLSMFEKENVLEKIRSGYLSIHSTLRGTKFKKILTSADKEKNIESILKFLKTEGLYIDTSTYAKYDEE